MKKKIPKNWGKFLIFGVVTFLLFGFSFFMLSSVSSQGDYSHHLFKPQLSQQENFSIISGLRNGDSFLEGEFVSINWSVTGYQNSIFRLKINGENREFGTIEGNNSYLIQQSVQDKTGWLAFSLEIYAGGLMTTDSAVVIHIIPQNEFWELYGVWVGASVVCVSITAINMVYGRHVRSKSQKQTRNSDLNKIPKSLMGSSPGIDSLDIWLTRSSEDEEEKTYLSSTRIEKCWIFNSEKMVILREMVFRDDLLEKERMVAINNDLRAHFKTKNVPNMICQGAFIANIPSLLASERLVILPLPSANWLILLSNGRLSKTYINVLNLLGDHISSLQDGGVKIINTGEFSGILERFLNISRSYTYIESPAITQRIITTSSMLKESPESDISNDARGLTPSDCEWVLKTMRELTSAEERERFFEEEVEVSLPEKAD